MEGLIPISSQMANSFFNRIFKVAIYIRLSREDGDKEESSSVTNQRDIITRFVNQNENFIIVDEYVDDGFTGTNFNRPGFQKMLKDIKEGKVDTVITKDLSRLGRDYIDTGYYVQRFFPENNIRYIALLDNIDTLQDGGMDEMAPFKAVINDMYVRDISKKITSSLRERKTAGNFLGVTAPYGYMKNPENKYQLVINEMEAKVVRHIFELYLKGNGLTKIAQILTNEGVPVPGKSRNIGTTRQTELYNCWKQTTIKRILDNQVYIGNLVQLKQKKLNYKSKMKVNVPEEQRVVCENTHEPIIDKNTFELVQNLIKGHKAFKNGTTHDYLFKGLLYCADCGAKLYLSYSHYALKKYGEYRYTTICYTYSRLYNKCTRHSNSIPVLEKLLIENIKKVCGLYIDRNLKNELVDLAKQAQKNKKEQARNKKQLQELEQKINELSMCIRNLYVDKVKEVISEKEFKELSKTFEKEKEYCIIERARILKKINGQDDEDIDQDKIEKLAKEFISLEKPTKELLHQLVEKITISEENEVTIYFKFKELTNISQEEENKLGLLITETKKQDNA